MYTSYSGTSAIFGYEAAVTQTSGHHYKTPLTVIVDVRAGVCMLESNNMRLHITFSILPSCTVLTKKLNTDYNQPLTLARPVVNRLYNTTPTYGQVTGAGTGTSDRSERRIPSFNPREIA